MLRLSRKGFTLVEIITVVFIVALLSTALYMWVQPYMKRSRDTRRITDMGSYMNILDVYGVNFETFPSNRGSGGTLIPGYCLSEIYTRPSYIWFRDKQFEVLGRSSIPPRDPSWMWLIAPCDMTGSYLYSRMVYGVDREIAIIAAELEMKTSANYGTGADLVDTGSIDNIINAKKWTVTDDAPDSLYIVYKTR